MFQCFKQRVFLSSSLEFWKIVRDNCYSAVLIVRKREKEMLRLRHAGNERDLVLQSLQMRSLSQVHSFRNVQSGFFSILAAKQFFFFSILSLTRLTRIQKKLWRRGWRHLYIFEYINLLQLMFKSYIKIQSVIKIEFIFVSLSGDNFYRLILFI